MEGESGSGMLCAASAHNENRGEEARGRPVPSYETKRDASVMPSAWLYLRSHHRHPSDGEQPCSIAHPTESQPTPYNDASRERK
eukprot:scaffold7374_cov112-Isochrysis_galbana.AAC.13